MVQLKYLVKDLPNYNCNFKKNLKPYRSPVTFVPVQPSSQWVPTGTSLGKDGRGVKLRIQYTLPWLRMRIAVTPTPPLVVTAYCFVKQKKNFTFTFTLNTTFINYIQVSIYTRWFKYDGDKL
jgi:hypothetical protein